MTEMEKWKTEYFKSVGEKYSNHVNKFVEYLKDINKSDTPNKIDLEDVRKCIKTYRDEGSIKSISSMALHLESLKSFYDYLLRTGKSKDIFSQMDYSEFKNELSKEFNLVEKVEREILSIETIKDILDKLDEYLYKDYYELKGKNNISKKYIHTITLNLFVKITLIAPAKRKIIGNIKYGDFKQKLRQVTVNGVDISIPNSLRRDLIYSINLIKDETNKSIKNDDNIFKYIAGENFKEENINTWLYNFIKENKIKDIYKENELRGTFPIESIMKTAISNLVEGQANLAYISKISGIKIARLEKTYYDSIFNYENKKLSIGKAIDFEIRKSEYYTYI